MREDEARPLAAEGRVVIWEKGWLTLPLSLAWLAAQGDKKRIRAARHAIEHVWRQPAASDEGGATRVWY
jgi:hypothetical protein